MRVKSIKRVEPRTVYAVQTSTGTYIADGLAHHNCKRCNKWLSGNLIQYKLALERKYGPGTGDKLEKLAQDNPYHYIKKPELLQIIHDSKLQIHYMENTHA